MMTYERPSATDTYWLMLIGAALTGKARLPAEGEPVWLRELVAAIRDGDSEAVRGWFAGRMEIPPGESVVAAIHAHCRLLHAEAVCGDAARRIAFGKAMLKPLDYRDFAIENMRKMIEATET